MLLFAGPVCDRWGAKKTILLGLAICTVGQILFAYMPTFGSLLAVRTFLGFGVPMLYLAPFAMAVRWFEQSNKVAVSLGVMSSADGIGTLFALYGFSYVLIALGWRTGSAVGAIVVLFMFFMALVFLKEPANFHQVSQKVFEKEMLRDYVKVIRKKNIYVASAFMIGVWGAYGIAVYWVPTLLIEDAGWSESFAGLLGALYPVVGIIGAVSFGLLSDRIGKRKPLMLVAGIGMVAAFFGLAWAQVGQQYVVFAVLLGVAGLFSYCGMPLCYALAADTVGARHVAAANGVVMSLGMVVGGVAYPLLLGYIKDATDSYNWGFIAAGCSLVLLNIVSVIMGNDVREDDAVTGESEEAPVGV